MRYKMEASRKYQPIEKSIEPSLDKILDLMNPANFEVNLAGHHLHGRVFELIKGDRQYNFSSSSTILKGVQTHKEIQFDGSVTVEFNKSDQKLYVLGKHILVNSISYNEEFSEKLFSGSISSFSTSRDTKSFNDYYLRFIIPVGDKEVFNIGQFQRKYFTTPHKKSPWFITLHVLGAEFHLFNYKLGDGRYLIIDCLSKSSLNTFQKKCFNILLALGFIKGNLIHDECFILSYESEEMEYPENILYHSMRASVDTNQPTFTSNPFSVCHDIDFPRDENGMITKETQDELYEGIRDFPAEVFSNLASLCYEQEIIQRAALIFIQSHVASLEIRIPNYYVAIEAITGYISSELTTTEKTLSPIKNKSIADTLLREIKDIALKAKTENSQDDNQFDWNIFEKNINKLNAPPNADKLSESFSYVSYALSSEQKKILKERNRYLHGSFLKTVDDDKAFRDALHVGLRLHFMIALLILKLAGYSGKIINYAELWAHITERTLGEERLIEI